MQAVSRRRLFVRLPEHSLQQRRHLHQRHLHLPARHGLVRSDVQHLRRRLVRPQLQLSLRRLRPPRHVHSRCGWLLHVQRRHRLVWCDVQRLPWWMVWRGVQLLLQRVRGAWHLCLWCDRQRRMPARHGLVRGDVHNLLRRLVRRQLQLPLLRLRPPRHVCQWRWRLLHLCRWLDWVDVPRKRDDDDADARPYNRERHMPFRC